MKSLMTLMLTMTLASASSSAGCDPAKDATAQKNAQGHSTPQPSSRRAEQKPEPGANQESGDRLRVLAEGNASSVEESFVFVARNSEAYTALRELVKNLPEQSSDFFRTGAVVAAFLGSKPTGGYRVQVESTAPAMLRVGAQNPPPDAILSQAFTSPFKIVALALGEDATVEVATGEEWQTRSYRVTRGEWTTSGGIIGRAETFAIKGELRVMLYGNLATLFLALEEDKNTKRMMRDVATGKISGNSLEIVGLDAGALVTMPHGKLKAKCTFGDDGKKLSLDFTSYLPEGMVVNDGFSGAGNLQAEATSAAPNPDKGKRRAAILGDEP